MINDNERKKQEFIGQENLKILITYLLNLNELGEIVVISKLEMFQHNEEEKPFYCAEVVMKNFDTNYSVRKKFYKCEFEQSFDEVWKSIQNMYINVKFEGKMLNSEQKMIERKNDDED